MPKRKLRSDLPPLSLQFLKEGILRPKKVVNCIPEFRKRQNVVSHLSVPYNILYNIHVFTCGICGPFIKSGQILRQIRVLTN